MHLRTPPHMQDKIQSQFLSCIFFSFTGCHTNGKEPRHLYLSPMARVGGEDSWMHTFPKGISAM